VPADRAGPARGRGTADAVGAVARRPAGLCDRQSTRTRVDAERGPGVIAAARRGGPRDPRADLGTDLARIEYDGWARRNIIGTPSAIPLQVKVRVWYSATLRRVVRFESDVRPSGPGIYASLASREVVELVRVKRTR